MGRKVKTLQTSLTAGELDPLLAAREDIKYYYSGAEKLRNCFIRPQGGAYRRPGLEFVDTLPPPIEQYTEINVLSSAPNGGTVANAYDGDETTELLTTTNLSTTTGYEVVEIVFDEEQDVVFVDVVGMKITSGTSDEEFAVYYSTVYGGANYQFQGGRKFSDVNTTRKNFRQTSNNGYNGTTCRTVQVRRGGVGLVDLGTAKASLLEIRVWIAGTGSENGRLIEFKYSIETEYMLVHTGNNVSVYKAGALQANVYSPIASSELAEMNYVQSLDTLLLFHKSHQPHKIVRQGTDTNWVDEALTLSNIPQYDFGGGDENMWSDTRGWPQCGTFFEARLWLGGSTERPQTFAGSKVASFFDFDEGTGLADEAIVGTLDTDDVSEIYNIYGGRHLQILTSSGEFYVLPESEPVQPDNIVVKRTSEIGSKGPGVRAGGVEGATLFLQKGGKAVREMLFTDTEQKYTTQNISLLSSHLLSDPSSFAIRRATSTDEADLILLPNDDGTLATLLTLRSQELTGWTRAETGDLSLSSTTAGYRAIKDVAALLEDIYVIVEYRTVADATVRYLEKFNSAHYLDSSVRVTSGLPTSAISNLDHLEGATVVAYVDGANLGTYTVSSGAIALSRDAETYAEVGLALPDVKENEVQRLMTAESMSESEARTLVFGESDGTGSGDGVWIKDMPVSPRLQDGSLIGELKRCYEADIVCRRTQHFYIGANDEAAQLIQFREMGAALGDPPPTVTRTVIVDDLPGWSLTGQVELTQRDPGPMTIQALKKKVAI